MIADMDRKFIHEQQKLSESEFVICDAIELNWNTWQKLKKGMINDDTINALFLYLFDKIVIFIDEEMKDGDIHWGRSSEIIKNEKYAPVIAKLRRLLSEEVRK